MAYSPQDCKESDRTERLTHALGVTNLAYKLQLLKPECLELVLCNKRSQRNEKLVHHNEK